MARARIVFVIFQHLVIILRYKFVGSDKTSFRKKNTEKVVSRLLMHFGTGNFCTICVSIFECIRRILFLTRALFAAEDSLTAAIFPYLSLLVPIPKEIVSRSWQPNLVVSVPLQAAVTHCRFSPESSRNSA